jgi:hypothetical protein
MPSIESLASLLTKSRRWIHPRKSPTRTDRLKRFTRGRVTSLADHDLHFVSALSPNAASDPILRELQSTANYVARWKEVLSRDVARKVGPRCQNFII